jgi:uncharacterized membrane protein YkvA (DUF1232 family)
MSILNNLKQRARQLKSEAVVLMIAYKDKRTPASARILIAITIGYLLSPIDLIPDFIPVLGLLDDLLIIPALIAWSIKLIPETVMQDARTQQSNNPLPYKKNNWLFAVIIIILWFSVLYLVFRWLGVFEKLHLYF